MFADQDPSETARSARAVVAATGLVKRFGPLSANEVVDLRVLRPLDDETIMQSVRKTHRVLVVDEGWKSGGISGELCTRICEQAFDDLDAAPARVCTAEVPLPYPKHLEDAAMPQPATIAAAARRLLGRPARGHAAADPPVTLVLPAQTRAG